MIRELRYSELKRFDVERDLSRAGRRDAFVGQPRAERALSFGLGMKAEGYNVYIAGAPGTGRSALAEAFARDAAKGLSSPDICYVYNFDDPQRPRLLTFAAGKGKVFSDEMDDLINRLTNELPQLFRSAEFDGQKHEIVKKYQDEREAVIKEISEEAKKNGFGVKMTNTGIYFMPIVNGEMISEEDFEALDDGAKKAISAKSDMIQVRALETMRVINNFEKSAQKDIKDLEYRIGLLAAAALFRGVMSAYEDHPAVLAHLQSVKEDVLDNLEAFCADETDDADVLHNIIPWAGKNGKEDFWLKYKANQLTDNVSGAAPVIVDYNPTLSNVTGEIEYDTELGNYTTDFMKIRPGLLHKANGGFLILRVSDLLSNARAWEAIKRVFKTGKLTVETPREYLSGLTVTGIKPEAADISVKLILIGDYYCYDLLSEFDDDFRKYFKILSAFDSEMRYDDQNIAGLAGFIKKHAAKTGVSFTPDAAALVVEQSMRECESQDKLSARFEFITELLEEAAQWARLDGADEVGPEFVRKAVREKRNRVDIFEEKILEMIEKDVVMIETSGAKTAQINGLAIYDTGDYAFAKPVKITATVYAGKSGVVNVEKEVEMSGSIHDKGVEVVVGYLGRVYAQEFPLSLSCRVCFEQNYSGVDGDSASSAELYAILSSLADAPVRQEIAVTGSVNQMGEIQAIGGVTAKIEGFFGLCEKRGLTGEQGVVIPERNTSDLMLNDEVIRAVKEKKFHIYAITLVDDGISLLTGLPAGTRNEKGKFPSNSVHGRAYKKLKEFHKKSEES